MVSIFSLHVDVSTDSIDSHLAYRLIEPTYANWNSMAICQRELSSFKETEIISNKKAGRTASIVIPLTKETRMKWSCTCAK